MWGIKLVIEDDEKHNECLIDICGYSFAYEEFMGEYDSYNYDDSTSICYCWKDNKIAIEKYMR